MIDKPSTTKHFTIKGLGISDRDFNRLHFGQQLDFLPKMSAFKEGAKSTHFSAKGIPFNKGLEAWKKLYKPTEYFCVCSDIEGVWKDDSVQVWYK